MKKLIYVLFLAVPSLSFTETVPKDISIFYSMDYLFLGTVERNAFSFGLGKDFAWQVGGLGTDYPHYLTVPLTFSYHPMGRGGEGDTWFLRYGWTTRHYLTPKSKGGIYIGYGLLLNQLFIDGTAGKALGHETAFIFGWDFYKSEQNSLFTQINGRYASFGLLGDNDGLNYYGVEIQTGFRFH